MALCLHERRRFAGQAGRSERLGRHGRATDGREVQHLLFVNLAMHFSVRTPASRSEVIDLPLAWLCLRALEDSHLVLDDVLVIAGLLQVLHVRSMRLKALLRLSWILRRLRSGGQEI